MVNFADSLIRGIELLMIGTSFGTTIFFLLKAIAGMKCYILFSVIFICKKKFFDIFTCSKYVLISVASARIAAMALWMVRLEI